MIRNQLKRGVIKITLRINTKEILMKWIKKENSIGILRLLKREIDKNVLRRILKLRKDVN